MSIFDLIPFSDWLKLHHAIWVTKHMLLVKRDEISLREFIVRRHQFQLESRLDYQPLTNARRNFISTETNRGWPMRCYYSECFWLVETSFTFEIMNIWKSYMWTAECRIIWRNIIAVLYATYAVAKTKPEWNSKIVKLTDKKHFQLNRLKHKRTNLLKTLS